MNCWKNTFLPVLLSLALFLQPAVALAVRQVNRSAEYPSPMGIYDSVSASRYLRVGVKPTIDPLVDVPTPIPGAADPLTAAQGLVTINGNLHIQPLDVNFTDTPSPEATTTTNYRDIVIDENLQVGGDTLKMRSIDWYGESHWTYINVPGYPSLNSRSSEMHVNGDVYAQHFKASQQANLSPDNEQLLFFGPANDGDAHDGQWVDLRSKIGLTTPLSGAPPQEYGWEHAHSVLVIKGNPYVCLNGYSGAPVGIGTETPGYMLQIGNAGDGFQAIGHSWQVFSSREYKTDIRPLSRAEYGQFADKAADLNLVRYHYKKDRPEDAKKFGVIAEEAPKEIISNDGKAMSLGDTVGFLFAAIRGMKAENDRLKIEIEKLEKEGA